MRQHFNFKKGAFLFFALFLGSMIGLTGCQSPGSSPSSSGGGTGLSTIEDLPKATSPVESSSAALTLTGKGKAATTGIELGTLDGNTFGSDSSVAACEATMRFREAIRSAAQGDLILCYVQQVFESNPDINVDIYDGDYHIFDLNFLDEGEGGAGRVKMRIIRNDAGAITDFEMFMCGDQGSGADQQSEYLHQAIGEDGSVQMTSKGFFSDPDGGMGSHRVTVAGQLGDNGLFTGSKTIRIGYNYESSGNSGRGESTVEQGADTIAFDGYETGSFSFEGNEGTYQNRAYVAAELLDGNADDGVYDIGLLAVGDGAAHAFFSGSSGSGSWTNEVVEGWSGDTTAADPSSPLIPDVEGVTPTEAAASVDIEFAASESWDCSGTGATVIVDQSGLDGACSNLDLGYEWVNCWEVAGGDGD